MDKQEQVINQPIFYLFKVNNGNSRIMGKICSKLKINAPEKIKTTKSLTILKKDKRFWIPRVKLVGAFNYYIFTKWPKLDPPSPLVRTCLIFITPSCEGSKLYINPPPPPPLPTSYQNNSWFVLFYRLKNTCS